jgi:hypothetical protein
MKRLIVSFLALSAPALGCALHQRPAPPPAQTRVGPVESFGRGIVESDVAWVRFDLDTAGYVIALRVADPWSVIRFRAYIPRECVARPTPRFRELLRRGCSPSFIDVIEPVSGGRHFDPGVHTIRPRLSLGRTVRWSYGMPYYAAGYWVLIVSDAPISVSEVYNAVIAPQDADTILGYLANRIPAALIGARTKHWVAYVAPFGNDSL